MDYVLEQVARSAGAAAIDPFVIVIAALIGNFVVDRRERAVLCLVLGQAVSLIIVLQLHRLTMILPSDEPAVFFGGSVGRTITAFVIAELAAWARRHFRRQRQ